MAEQNQDRQTPPYVAWGTFENFLTNCAENSLPRRIDRSVLSHAEGVKTQLLTALKFFGLISENGLVQERLTQLVEASPDERKDLVAQLLRENYPGLVHLGESRGTQNEFEEAWREYPAAGDTARKAKTFYLNAAQYAGIALSPFWQPPGKTRSTNGNTSRVRRTRRTDVNAQQGSNEWREPPSPSLPRPPDQASSSGIDPVYIEVLKRLPVSRTWTQAAKERWMRAIEAVVDLTIEIEEPQSGQNPPA